MDFLFEILGEILGGLYFGLAELIVPDKQFTKAQKTVLQTVCMIVMLASVGVLWAGVIYLEDGYGFTEGVIMISVGSALIALHVVLGVIVTVRSYRNNKKSGK